MSQVNRIIILGDSTVKDWHRLLIKKGPWEVFTISHGGGVTGSALAHLKYEVLDFSQEYPGETAPIGFTDVILAVGINDLKGNGTPQTAFATISTMISWAKGEGKRVWFVSVLPSQLAEATVPGCMQSRQEIKDLNALVQAHPDLDGYVDLWNDFWDDATDQPRQLFQGAGPSYPRSELYIYEYENIDVDCNGTKELTTRFVHPSAEGGRIIADAVIGMLLQVAPA